MQVQKSFNECGLKKTTKSVYHVWAYRRGTSPKQDILLLKPGRRKIKTTALSTQQIHQHVLTFIYWLRHNICNFKARWEIHNLFEGRNHRGRDEGSWTLISKEDENLNREKIEILTLRSYCEWEQWTLLKSNKITYLYIRFI